MRRRESLKEQRWSKKQTAIPDAMTVSRYFGRVLQMLSEVLAGQELAVPADPAPLHL